MNTHQDDRIYDGYCTGPECKECKHYDLLNMKRIVELLREKREAINKDIVMYENIIAESEK